MSDKAELGFDTSDLVQGVDKGVTAINNFVSALGKLERHIATFDGTGKVDISGPFTGQILKMQQAAHTGVQALDKAMELALTSLRAGNASGISLVAAQNKALTSAFEARLTELGRMSSEEVNWWQKRGANVGKLQQFQLDEALAFVKKQEALDKRRTAVATFNAEGPFSRLSTGREEYGAREKVRQAQERKEQKEQDKTEKQRYQSWFQTAKAEADRLDKAAETAISESRKRGQASVAEIRRRVKEAKAETDKTEKQRYQDWLLTAKSETDRLNEAAETAVSESRKRGQASVKEARLRAKEAKAEADKLEKQRYQDWLLAAKSETDRLNKSAETATNASRKRGQALVAEIQKNAKAVKAAEDAAELARQKTAEYRNRQAVLRATQQTELLYSNLRTGKLIDKPAASNLTALKNAARSEQIRYDEWWQVRQSGDKRLNEQAKVAVEESRKRGKALVASIVQTAKEVKAAEEAAFETRSQSAVRNATRSTQSAYTDLRTGNVIDRSAGTVTNPFTGQVRETAKARKGMRGLGDDMGYTHSMARGLASGFNLLWLTWGSLAPLFVGAAISNGFMQTAKSGMEVAHTFKTIETLGGATAEEVARLQKNLTSLGYSGPVGPIEAAEAMKILTLAGLDANEVLATTKSVLNFSVAGTTDMKTAAETLVSVSSAFGMGSAGFGRVSDVISKAAAVSMSSVDSFAEAMKTASVVSSQYGVTLEDTATQIAVLSQVGIKGTAAGTALRNAYADLSGRSKQVAAALEKVGVSARDSTGRFKPIIDVVDELRQKMAPMTGIGRANFLQTILSERGAKGIIEMLQLIQREAKNSGTGMTNALAEMRRAIDESAGFAAVSAAKMAMSAQSQFKAVKATFETTMQEAYRAMEPQLLLIADRLKTAFGSPEAVKGLQLMVTSIANLTVVVTENAKTFAILGAGYLAFSAIQATVLGTRRALIAAGEVYNAVKVRAAALTVAETAATTANTVAETANARAKATKLGWMLGIGRLIPGLNIALGLATAGTIAYEFWRNKANDSDEAAAQLYDTTLSKSLRDQTAKLERINALRITGITLAEAQKRIEAEDNAVSLVAPASRLANNASGVEFGERRKLKAMREELSKLNNAPGVPFTTKTQVAQEVRSQEAVVEKAIAERKRLQAAVTAGKEQADKDVKGLVTASRKQNDWLQSELSNRQNAVSYGTQDFDKAAAGAGKAAAATNKYTKSVRDNISELQSQTNAAVSANAAVSNSAREILDKREQVGLASAGEHAVRLARITQDAEAAQVTIIEKGMKAIKQAQESTNREHAEKAAQDIANSRLKGAELVEYTENRNAELKEVQDATDEKAKTALDTLEADKLKITTTASKRREIAALEHEGRLLKIKKDFAAEWAKDSAKEALNAQRAALESQYKDLPTEPTMFFGGRMAEAAQAKASLAVYEEYSSKVADLNRELAETKNSYADAMSVLHSTPPDLITVEQVAALDRALAIYKELSELSKQLGVKIDEEAVDKGGKAFKETMLENTDLWAGTLAESVYVALSEGGQKGSDVIKEQLKRALKQELTMNLKGVFKDFLGSLGGGQSSGVGGMLGNALGLTGMGSIFSGAAASGASALFAGYGGSALAGGISMLTGAGGGLAAISTGLGAIAGVAGPVAIGLGLVSSGLKRTHKESGKLAKLNGQGSITTSSYDFYKGGWLKSDKTTTGALNDGGAFESQVRVFQNGAEAMARVLGLSSDAVKNFTGEVKVNLKGLNAEEAAAKTSEAMVRMQAEMLATAEKGPRLTENLLGTSAAFETTVNKYIEQINAANTAMSSAGITSEAITDILVQGMTGRLTEAQVGEQMADIVLGGIYNSIAQGFAQQITDVFMAQIMQPIFMAVTSGVPVTAAITQAAIDNTIATAQNAVNNLNAIFSNPGFQAMMGQLKSTIGSIAGISVKPARSIRSFGSAVSAAATAAKAAADEYYGLETQLLELLGNTAKLRERELNSLNAGSRALQLRIWSLEDAKDGMDSAYEALERAIDAQRTIVEGQLDTATETQSALSDVFDLLKDNIRELMGLTDETAQMHGDSARALIRAAIASGVAPSTENLSNAISSSRNQVENARYATSVSRNTAVIKLANDLSALQTTVLPQLTAAEQQVELLKNQLSAMDSQLKVAEDQMNALLGIDASVKTVTSAVDALNAAMATYEAARNAAAATPTATAPTPATTYTGGSSSGSSTSTKTWQQRWNSTQYYNRYKDLRDYWAVNGAALSSDARFSNPANGGTPLQQWLLHHFVNTGMSEGRNPGFAKGGSYSGGMALVGEEGPELINFRNPGQVYTAPETAELLSGGRGDGGETTSILRELLAEVRASRAESQAVALSSARTERLIKRVTRNGEAMVVMTDVNPVAVQL